MHGFETVGRKLIDNPWRVGMIPGLKFDVDLVDLRLQLLILLGLGREPHESPHF